MASVFPSEQAQELYRTDLDLHWRNEIVEANANFKLAASVREVPLHLLLCTHSSIHLLGRIGENALRLAALDTINALTDTSKGTLTLEFLRKRAVSLSRPAVRHALKAYLDAEFQARKATELQQRAKQLRNNVLAHSNAEVGRNPRDSDSIRVSRQEIGQMLEAAKELVTVLSFDHGRSFDFLPGDDDYRMSHLIQEVIERHSFVLRMPEDGHPQVFLATWNAWSPAERVIFNEWRVRLGRRSIEADGAMSS
jgi:hypothetical protein